MGIQEFEKNLHRKIEVERDAERQRMLKTLKKKGAQEQDPSYEKDQQNDKSDLEDEVRKWKSEQSPHIDDQKILGKRKKP